jgi:16S rRNA G1207 methylase RsmC
VFSSEQVDEGTRLLAESMVIMNGWRILDMGCGYGVLGIIAAKLAPRGRVVMVDINRLAVKLAAINVKINNVRNARFAGETYIVQ